MVTRLLGPEFGKAWRDIVAGVNRCAFTSDMQIRYKVLATMMSGEQTTAFFNLVLNWLLIRFSAEENDY